MVVPVKATRPLVALMTPLFIKSPCKVIALVAFAVPVLSVPVTVRLPTKTGDKLLATVRVTPFGIVTALVQVRLREIATLAPKFLLMMSW